MTNINPEQIIDDLADQIHSPTPDTTRIPEAYLRFGIVDSVASGVVTFHFAGSSTYTARYIAGVTAPVAGDRIVIIQFRVPGEQTSYIILGKLS